MDVALQKHFVNIDGRHGPRRVHYRRAGTGPAVLLLHQSPQSSAEMEPLLRAHAHRFTLIAPDTPGYGASDPLGPEEITINDLAGALLEFADALGLGRFGIYGYHTGASTGMAAATLAPARVAALACNGLVLPTDAELGSILANYLPPFVPRWDGGHLAWLWSRNREQTVFFPWFDRRQAARMEFPGPTPERLASGAIEFLRAGDGYRHAYRAAFLSRAATMLPALRSPTLVTAAARDPLAAHLERAGERADCVSISRSEDPDSALSRCLAHLESHPGDGCPPPPAANPGSGDHSRMVTVAAGQLHLRQAGDSPAALLIHDLGGDTRTAGIIYEALAAHGPVAALDLPGHGESDPWPEAVTPSIDACAGAVADVASRFASVPRLVGTGWGGLVALAASARTGGPPPLLLDPPAFDDAMREAFLAQGLPSLAPTWHGGHLLEAWHMVRDGRLFFPWFRREPDAIRRIEPDLDDQAIQREVTALLRANGTWQTLMRDALATPLAARLATAPAGTTLAAQDGYPLREAAKSLAGATAGVVFTSPADALAGTALADG